MQVMYVCNPNLPSLLLSKRPIAIKIGMPLEMEYAVLSRNITVTLKRGVWPHFTTQCQISSGNRQGYNNHWWCFAVVGSGITYDKVRDIAENLAKDMDYACLFIGIIASIIGSGAIHIHSWVGRVARCKRRQTSIPWRVTSMVLTRVTYPFDDHLPTFCPHSSQLGARQQWSPLYWLYSNLIRLTETLPRAASHQKQLRIVSSEIQRLTLRKSVLKSRS